MTVPSLQKMFSFLHHDHISNVFLKNTMGHHQYLSMLYIFLLAFSFIIASIIFFFAFNWQAIPDFVKLAGIEILFILGAVGAMRYGLQSTLGKLALTFASLLVGVFFAVFGQIYQTGADSYTLFLLWSLAITPFVIISNFSTLWIILLILLNTTLGLMWNTLFWQVQHNEQIFLSIFMACNGSVLFLREIFLRKFTWLQNYATRIIPYICTLGALVSQIIIGITDTFFSSFTFSGIFCLLLLLFMYRHKYKDILLCAINLITICFLLIFSIVVHVDLNVYLYMCISLFAIALFTYTGKYLERLYKIFHPSNTNAHNEDSLCCETKRPSSVKEKSITKTHVHVLLKTFICGISAIISASILSAFFSLLYYEFAQDTYFLALVGGVSLIFSLFLSRKTVQQKTLYFTSYQELTAIVLGYALITINILVIEGFSHIQLSLIFFLITTAIFPFVHNALSRILIALYTMLLLYMGHINPLYIAIINVCALFMISHKKLYEHSQKIVIHSIYTSFAIITAQTLLMLVSPFTSHTEELYHQYFSSILTLWIFALAFLSIKTHTAAFSSFSLTQIMSYMLAMMSIVFFAYIQAYSILFCIGMLLLGIYLKKVLLLHVTMLLSIPILFLYYYNLSITLLYKSYSLLISGCILLIFCACNAKVLHHEK